MTRWMLLWLLWVLVRALFYVAMVLAIYLLISAQTFGVRETPAQLHQMSGH